MNGRSSPPILLGLALLFSGSALAQERPAEDLVTKQLFEQYVARTAKINTSSVMAATHLVAERGRESGFWKEVLAELKRNDERSEIGCVRVLGKMLETDAAARDTLRRQKETGEVSAWIAAVCLSPEVVTELVERGLKADRFRIDHYTIALVRARTPEARDFFKSILHANFDQRDPVTTVPAQQGNSTPKPVASRDQGIKADVSAPNRPYHLESTRFHAAVGLAQLGDSEGLDWLIANCEYGQGTVMLAWPVGAPRGGDLSACCQEALRHLSLEDTRTSKAEWAAWAKSLDKKLLRDRAVAFGDP